MTPSIAEGKRVILVSDLHLRGDQDPTQISFLDFLDSRVAPDADCLLVIAGDLVDFWLAIDDRIPAHYRSLIERLASLPEVWWLEGNHDIGLGRALHQVAGGLHFRDRPFDIDWGGLRFRVEHGDQVDRRDLASRILHPALRSPVLRSCLAALGADRVNRIGMAVTASQSEAKAAAPAPSARWLAEARGHAVRCRDELGVDLCILGHGHHLGWWSEGLICLGDWLHYRSYLELSPDQGGARLRQFSESETPDPVLTSGPVGALARLSDA